MYGFSDGADRKTPTDLLIISSSLVSKTNSLSLPIQSHKPEDDTGCVSGGVQITVQ